MKTLPKVVVLGAALGGAVGGLFARTAQLAAPYVVGVLFSSQDLPFPTVTYFFLFGLCVAGAVELWLAIAIRRQWLPTVESPTAIKYLSSAALLACSWPGAVLAGLVSLSISSSRLMPISFCVAFVLVGATLHGVAQIVLGGELRVWQAGVIVGCWGTPLLAVTVVSAYLNVGTPVVEATSAAGVTAATMVCVWGQSFYRRDMPTTEAPN